MVSVANAEGWLLLLLIVLVLVGVAGATNSDWFKLDQDFLVVMVLGLLVLLVLVLRGIVY